MRFSASYSEFGVLLLGLFGALLGYLALRAGMRPARSGHGRRGHRDVDRLLDEIGRGVRMLADPSRFGGLGLLREKQYEVARQLGELQRRLSQLEDGTREHYEARAHRVLELAAKCGITVPPP
jgi:hypothetical protein